MVILEIFQKQTFDVIAMIPRWTLGFCCTHIAQLMIYPAIHTLPFTLQLCYKALGIVQRVTKNQKVQISSHDQLRKLHNINFTWHRSLGFLRERVEKQEFPPSPVTFFKTIKNPFPRTWESIDHIKWGAGKKLGFLYRDTLWTFLLW